MNKDYKSLRPLLTTAVPPLDVAAEFGRRTALEVEIGFGNGEYLARRAAEHPGIDFIGLEINWRTIRSALRKIALTGLTNVRLMPLDARTFMSFYLPPRLARRIYSLFPFPWPKEKHHRHRLFTRSFLREVNSRLEDGGEFQMVTDDADFFEWSYAQSRGCGFKRTKRRVAPRFRTKFEWIWQSQGQQEFYEMILVKKSHCDIPLKEGMDLKTYRLSDFDPAVFRPRGCTGKELTVKFEEFLFDPEKQKGMQMVIVVENDRRQQFWIEIYREQRGWRVRPARGGHILPTRGVQEAVRLAAEGHRPG